jgi:hypothetical protein
MSSMPGFSGLLLLAELQRDDRCGMGSLIHPPFAEAPADGRRAQVAEASSFGTSRPKRS